MDNAWCAVKDGGVVILVGECREGSGSALYEKTMREFKTPENIEAALRADFQVGAHKAYAVTRLMKRAEFILVSNLEPELARMLLFTPAQDMAEALELAEIVGVTRQTINAIENGDYNPSIRLCIAICKALNRTLDQIFWEDDDNAE